MAESRPTRSGFLWPGATGSRCCGPGSRSGWRSSVTVMLPGPARERPRVSASSASTTSSGTRPSRSSPGNFRRTPMPCSGRRSLAQPGPQNKCLQGLALGTSGSSGIASPGSPATSLVDPRPLPRRSAPVLVLASFSAPKCWRPSNTKTASACGTATGMPRRKSRPATACSPRQLRLRASSPPASPRRQPKPWDRCYAIATPKRAFNIFINVTSLARSHERERQPGSSIMVFSPAALAAALLDLDDSEIINRYLNDLDNIFPGFSGHIIEAHVRRWPLGLAYCFPGRGRIQKALTRPGERIHLAGDYLGTFYTETAVETGWKAANTILRALA